MSKLNKVFAAWGDNVTQMARAIGENEGTVRKWRERDNIPHKYWPKIIAEAGALGAKLTWRDFLTEIAA